MSSRRAAPVGATEAAAATKPWKARKLFQSARRTTSAAPWILAGFGLAFLLLQAAQGPPVAGVTVVDLAAPSSFGLCGVAAFFNPAGAASRRENYRTFYKSAAAQGLRLWTVELAFAEAPFELDATDADVLLRRRTGAANVMWQKERLLNLAITSLPSTCTKVAWIDTELLFANQHWVREAAELLDSVKVVQLFDRVIPLERGIRYVPTSARITEGIILQRRHIRHYSLASVMAGVNAGDSAGFAALNKRGVGKQGYAWAARREVIVAIGGLYDAGIVGGGDTLIAHAMFGNFQGSLWNRKRAVPRFYSRFAEKSSVDYPDTEKPLPANSSYDQAMQRAGNEQSSNVLNTSATRHYDRWAKKCFNEVAGEVGFVRGAILHLWHGTQQNRQYESRFQTLRTAKFDPNADVRVNPATGIWEWSSDKPRMHDEVKEYFVTRDEGLGLEMVSE